MLISQVHQVSVLLVVKSRDMLLGQNVFSWLEVVEEEYGCDAKRGVEAYGVGVILSS